MSTNYEFKGTRGPWWIGGDNTKVIATIPGYSTSWYIADCKVPERILGGIETFRSKENAALIAAAPDLLQAATEAITSLELVELSENVNLAYIIEPLKAAIQKALNV